MRKADKIKTVIITLTMIFRVIFLSINREFFIDKEKVGNVGFVANNHTAPILNDSSVQVNIKTESEAHSLQFLFVPPTEKGGEDVIVTVTDSNMDIRVEYIVPWEELHSGEYIVVPLKQMIGKGNDCVVSINSSEIDINKATRLVVGDSRSTDVVSWYFGEEIMSDIPTVSLIYNSVKTMSVLIVFSCFLVIMYAFARILTKEENKALSVLLSLAVPFVAAGMVIVTVYLSERLQWGNILTFGNSIIIANILVVVSISLFLFFLTGKVLTSVSLSVIIAIILSIANHYLILFRGTTLLPADFTGIATAAKVLDSYIIEFDDSVICSLLMVISARCLIVSDNNKIRLDKLKSFLLRLASVSVSAVLMFTLACRPQIFGAEVYLWKQQTAARLMNGFLMNFTINVPLLIREKPDNYDVSLLDTYVDIGKAAENEINAKITEQAPPNILFVMNESFSDPRTVFNVKDADKLLPNLDRLKNDERAFVGQTAVSVFGGGTSCSEYEMLTGFSIRTDNANTAPYLTYFRNNTPSLVWYLNNLGYETSSYHPAMSRNWYRNSSYPHMGFERRIFLNESNNTLEDSSGKLMGQPLNFDSKYSDFPSDKSGYDIILDIMKETSEPVFNFHITMRNHGGYPDKEEKYDISQDEWSIYLKLMNRSDEQLGNFLSKLSDFKEPTVVVFFGDHWSYYDEEKLSLAGISLDTMTQQQLTNYYSTPYIVWSNCGYDFSSMPRQTSLPYLSSLVMHQLGFELTPWQNYLVYWSDKVPVYSVYNLIKNVDEEVFTDYEHQMKCLHYNALNDESNRNDKIFGKVG